MPTADGGRGTALAVISVETRRRGIRVDAAGFAGPHATVIPFAGWSRGWWLRRMADVLIVVGDDLMTWALRTRLEQWGHTVRSAGTLDGGRAALEDARPQLLLLDMSLPDGGGLDLLSAVGGGLDETIVIVMGAVWEPSEIERADRLGVSIRLAKPFSHEELLERIAARLDRLGD